MPGYQHVILEKDPDEGIARLIMNRPDRRNAFNDLMQDEMGEAVEEVESDDSIRVLIITGAGQAFCAGGDTAALKGGSEPGAWVSDRVDDIRRSFKRTQRFILGLQRMEKPNVVQVVEVAEHG